MDNKERKLFINKATTLPGVAVARTVTFPEISIAELEQELQDDEAFEELETADTQEIEVPDCEDDFEGPTGVYQIAPYFAAAQVYWVQRA